MFSVEKVECWTSVILTFQPNNCDVVSRDPIPPKESYTYTAEVYVYRSGTVTLMVDFDAVEIMNIKAEKDVTVVE